MVENVYRKPSMKTLDAKALNVAIGPCCTQYDGTLNVDMYRAQLKQSAEYRYAENFVPNEGVKNA